MDKGNAVCTYNGIFLILIKERYPAICDNTNEPGENYAKWVSLVTEGKYCMISLTWGTRDVQIHRSRK